jgi:DnaJ-domain-containing protein 1
MTDGEILASLFGLTGGYWIVTAAMNWKARQQGDRSYHSGSPNENASGDDQQGAYQTQTPDRRNPNGLRWFDVLGVPESSTREQIVLAYKRKISEYHPDKVARMGPEIVALAEMKSKQINAAYEAALKMRR